MTLTDLRNSGQVFCRISSVLTCLIFFSWLCWGYGFSERRQQRWSAILITSYQGNLLSTWLITWPSVHNCPFVTLCIVLTRFLSGFSPFQGPLHFACPQAWASTKMQDVPPYFPENWLTTVRHISYQATLVIFSLICQVYYFLGLP